ncbi:MAG: thioredoxin-disulfide reductase [Christensenellaceae bacterium]|jgi:thioredoxin reductase (NADPH)|nr:thioredoxin-disulfide reductase [Christensenellaceae bacterium]
MQKMYDILIIGGGPAGLAAGIYGSRARLHTAILEKGALGGQAVTTGELENYPGFFDGMSGPDVMKKISTHAKHFGTEFLTGTVTRAEFSGPIKRVFTDDGQEYQAKSVILAPGAEPRQLGVEGEREFRGRGVSYCATCDADFFEELDVAVVGNGDAAIEEALYLTRFANQVTMIVPHDEGVLYGNRTSVEKALANPKLKICWNSEIVKITGDGIVQSVLLRNVKTGEPGELALDGVFIFVGTVPKTGFLKEAVALDDAGYISVNERMETNIPGVYAAGDACAKFLRQVVTAVADGAIAAVAAEKYIEETETFRRQVLEADRPVLLLFWAARVPESVAGAGIIEAQLAGREDVRLVKLHAIHDKKTAEAYGVYATPTVLLFHDGKVLNRVDGPFTAEQVAALLMGLPAAK